MSKDIERFGTELTPRECKLLLVFLTEIREEAGGLHELDWFAVHRILGLTDKIESILKGYGY